MAIRGKTLIENWLINPIDINIYKESKDCASVIVKSLVKIRSLSEKNTDGPKDLVKRIRREADHFLDKNEPVEPNLFSFFLHTWALTLIRNGQFLETKNIFIRYDQINKKDLLPETIANHYMVFGLFHTAIGNKSKYESYMIKASQIKKLNRSHKELVINSYITFLCSHGKLQERKNKSFAISQESPYFLYNQFAEFINHINCMDITLAMEKRNQCYSHPMFNNPTFQNNFQAHNPTNQVYIDLWDIQNNRRNNRLIDMSNISESDYIYLSCKKLLENKSEEGLEWAKKGVNNLPETLLSSNINSYLLIRAELANKNTKAATKLLNAKIAQGNTHYLDDFFYARIHLLMNDKIKANIAFNKVQKKVKFYKAINRLLFEIDLSCEISKSQLYEFLQTNSKPSDTKIKDELRISEAKPNPNIGIERLKGESFEISNLKREIIQYSKFNHPILITGETGVGKEEVARALHEESDRAKEPFIAINCGAISDTLLQTELFGHKAGSFTGANKDYKGVFESAEKGTLFLDEIGEISSILQTALLRVLESGTIRPIGMPKEKKYECKILLATNQNLAKMTETKTFRKDLFFRINQFQLNIAPLRDRKEDILSLANFFYQTHNETRDSAIFSQETMEALEAYDWPGNVRELKHKIEKMIMLNSNDKYFNIIDFEKDSILGTTENHDSADSSHKMTQNPSSKLNQNDHIIQNEKTPLRRLQKLKQLFVEYDSLTRNEIIKMLNISSGTATSDLKKLQDENYIQKICPSASPRSHYFKRLES